jgi:molybdenum cofactor cytidylyltransferase
MGRLDAIIMASGLSQRMGCNKLLLPLGELTVVEQFLAHFPYGLFHKVIVVYSDLQVAAIAGKYSAILCHNQDPRAGKSHSIQLGLSRSTAEDGIMFAVADQPLLTGVTIRILVEMFYRLDCQKIIVPEVAGRPANPVIFPAACRREFAKLQGDSGGRQLIGKEPERVCSVPFGAEDEFRDVDTPESYQHILKLWSLLDKYQRDR